MSTDGKILIFIPTYNEKDNVELLYRRIKALNLNTDILFLDDNSPDGTGHIQDQIAAKDSRVTVIHRSGKLGIGTAHQEGIRYAYKKRYKTLVTMDADFTHSPENILTLLEHSKNAAVVVGSRYMQKGSLEGWNPLRKTLTLVAHFLTTVLLDLKYDATGAFRLYNLELIPVELFDLVKSRGYSFFFESLHLINLNRFKINEFAIALPPRTYGTSKMSYKDALKSLNLLFSTFVKTTLYKKSLTVKKPELAK